MSKMTGKLVAVVQMTSTANKAKNLATGKRLIEAARARGAKMAFLPEGFDYIAESKDDSVSMAETLNGVTVAAYRDIARQNCIALSLGGFHCKSDVGGKISNTHLIINECGDILETYEKCHLFDVDIPEKGIRLKESDYVEAGTEIAEVANTPVGKVGLAVCYDVRFPEISAALRQKGADILTFPSAFTVETGLAHWETLLRARAIENQCYVIAAAQVGRHNSKRASFGHSVIVDPWGTVVAACSDAEGIAVAEIDTERLAIIRRNMPIEQHRRTDIFGAKSTGIMSYEVGGVDSGSSWPFGQVEISNCCIVMHSSFSYVTVNRKPVVPGHLLVIPQRQGVQRWTELRPDEVSDLFNLAQKAQKLIQSYYAAPSATIAIQDGPEAGQTIKHVHIHLLPRKEGDFKQNDDVYRELSEHDKQAKMDWRSAEEMEEEAIKLKTHLKEIVGLI